MIWIGRRFWLIKYVLPYIVNARILICGCLSWGSSDATIEITNYGRKITLNLQKKQMQKEKTSLNIFNLFKMSLLTVLKLKCNYTKTQRRINKTLISQKVILQMNQNLMIVKKKSTKVETQLLKSKSRKIKSQTQLKLLFFLLSQLNPQKTQINSLLGHHSKWI